MIDKESDYLNYYSKFLKVHQNQGFKVYEEEIGKTIKYGPTQDKIDIRPHFLWVQLNFK